MKTRNFGIFIWNDRKLWKAASLISRNRHQPVLGALTVRLNFAT